MVEIRKPTRKMKTIVRRLELCLYFNDCRGCWLKKYANCQELLLADGLYYLRLALEKSEDRGRRGALPWAREDSSFLRQEPSPDRT